METIDSKPKRIGYEDVVRKEGYVRLDTDIYVCDPAQGSDHSWLRNNITWSFVKRIETQTIMAGVTGINRKRKKGDPG